MFDGRQWQSEQLRQQRQEQLQREREEELLREREEQLLWEREEQLLRERDATHVVEETRDAPSRWRRWLGLGPKKSPSGPRQPGAGRRR